MYSLPQLLPKRYTDDSIIPAIVTNVIPSAKVDAGGLGTVEGDGKGKRKSFMAKLKGGERKREEGKGGATAMVKVVYMPRREYTKFFARDLKGEYIGTEPYKQWTEDELEEMFKQYKPAPDKKTGYRAPF